MTITSKGKRFRRDRLPAAMAYFAAEGIPLIGRGLWRSALCPFHGESRPSLRIKIDTGAFRCMACGEHGGNVLDFHMKLHGVGFVLAARQLNAWEGVA